MGSPLLPKTSSLTRFSNRQREEETMETSATVKVLTDARVKPNGELHLYLPGYAAVAATNPKQLEGLRIVTALYDRSFELGPIASEVIQAHEILEHGMGKARRIENYPWRVLVAELVEGGIRIGFEMCRELLQPSVPEPEKTIENFDPCI